MQVDIGWPSELYHDGFGRGLPPGRFMELKIGNISVPHAKVRSY